MSNKGTSCPDCGHIFKGHENLVGKICTRCDAFIPPLRELPIVIENRMKYRTLLRVARSLIEKKQRGNNAD